MLEVVKPVSIAIARDPRLDWKHFGPPQVERSLATRLAIEESRLGFDDTLAPDLVRGLSSFRFPDYQARKAGEEAYQVMTTGVEALKQELNDWSEGGIDPMSRIAFGREQRGADRLGVRVGRVVLNTDHGSILHRRQIEAEGYREINRTWAVRKFEKQVKQQESKAQKNHPSPEAQAA